MFLNRNKLKQSKVKEYGRVVNLPLGCPVMAVHKEFETGCLPGQVFIGSASYLLRYEVALTSQRN